MHTIVKHEFIAVAEATSAIRVASPSVFVSHVPLVRSVRVHTLSKSAVIFSTSFEILCAVPAISDATSAARAEEEIADVD